jgi:hypothetical protein
MTRLQVEELVGKRGTQFWRKQTTTEGCGECPRNLHGETPSTTRHLNRESDRAK